MSPLGLDLHLKLNFLLTQKMTHPKLRANFAPFISWFQANPSIGWADDVHKILYIGSANISWNQSYSSLRLNIIDFCEKTRNWQIFIIKNTSSTFLPPYQIMILNFLCYHSKIQIRPVVEQNLLKSWGQLYPQPCENLNWRMTVIVPCWVFISLRFEI